MNKKVKSVFSACLTLALLAGSFSSCGENPSSSENSTNGSSTSDQKEISTLNVLCSDNTNPYIKFSEREQYPLWEEFESKLAERGVALEFEVVPSDQYPVVSQTRMSTGTDLPDFAVLSSLDIDTMITLSKQGMLIPIDDILEYSDGTAETFLNEKAPFVRQLNTLDDGNMYWFTSVLITTWGDTICQSPVVPNIRKDWLEALSLDIPTTIDEFYDTMLAFRENDMNKNGVADEVAVFNANFIGNPLAAWFGLGTDLVSIQLDTGEVVCPWYQDQMKDFILFMRKLIDAGIYDIALADQSDQLNTENKIGCVITYATQSFLEPTVNVGSAPAAEYQPFGPITAIEGVPAYATGDAATMSYGRYVFTKECKDLQAAASLLDFLYSEDYYLLTEWGIEGKSYEVIDGTPQFMEGVGQQYWEQLAKDRNSNGLWLWAFTAFPRVFPGQDLKVTEKNAAPYKLEYMEEFSKYPYKALTSGYETYYMAPPTEEEQQRKSEFYTDLKTYSDELFSKLIMNELSLDNWDTYINELKALGLDDYIEIQTERYNRYKNS